LDIPTEQNTSKRPLPHRPITRDYIQLDKSQ